MRRFNNKLSDDTLFDRQAPAAFIIDRVMHTIGGKGTAPAAVPAVHHPP
jgi:hypothetical protein